MIRQATLAIFVCLTGALAQTDTARIVGLVKVFLLPSFEAVALPAGAGAATVADYVARMVLSLIESPGRWDLTDRDQVKDLVRTELLAPLSQV